MIRFLILTLILLILSGQSANANVAFPKISTQEVIKDYKFKGGKVTVTVKYREPVEIMAIVTGPKVDFDISQKNSKHKLIQTLNNQESFYHIFVSNDKLKNNADIMLEKFQEEKKQLSKNGVFYNYMIDQDFYKAEVQEINNREDMKYFDINLPFNCPEGTYEVTLYLFSNTLQMFEKTQLSFRVATQGAYKFLQIFSKSHPVEYTSMVILIAIIMGLIAGLVNYNRVKS